MSSKFESNKGSCLYYLFGLFFILIMTLAGIINDSNDSSYSTSPSQYKAQKPLIQDTQLKNTNNSDLQLNEIDRKKLEELLSGITLTEKDLESYNKTRSQNINIRTNSVSPNDAYDEGYEEGYEQGRSDGASGVSHGYGYDDSNSYYDYYEKRYRQGYEEGYDEGYYLGQSEYEEEHEEEEREEEYW